MNSDEGIITKAANCTVEEAVNKIKSLLVIRGITLLLSSITAVKLKPPV